MTRRSRPVAIATGKFLKALNDTIVESAPRMLATRKRPRHRFTVYRAADGWRWKCRARNGRNVANGSEAYASRRNAERACETFVASMAHEVAYRSRYLTVIHCY